MNLAKQTYIVAEALFAVAIGLLSVAAGAKILAAVSADAHNVLNNAAVAAWVQAIGSIAAIAGAFAISSRQARNDRNQRWNERVTSKMERIASLTTILRTMVPAIESMDKWTASGGSAFLPFAEVATIERASKELTGIRVADLPSTLLGARTLSLQIQLPILLESVKRVANAYGTEEGPYPGLLNSPSRTLLAAREVIRTALEVAAQLEASLR